MDRCYYSHDPKASNFANQETLMSEMGIELRENALNGFNLTMPCSRASTSRWHPLAIPLLIDPFVVRPRVIDRVQSLRLAGLPEFVFRFAKEGEHTYDDARAGTGTGTGKGRG